MININIDKQILDHHGKTFSISTAKNGIGEMDGSYCTPTGKFKISEKNKFMMSNSNVQLVKDNLPQEELCFDNYHHMQIRHRENKRVPRILYRLA